LQGPHQGAQKSTSNGISLPLMAASKASAVNSTGIAANIRRPQEAQARSALKFSAGIRSTAPQ
jgi:hypothetical protein